MKKKKKKTYAEAKKTTFVETGLTRSDISFTENNQYTIFPLKQSKTNTKHIGMQIILAAIGIQICPVEALQRLFIEDSRPSNTLLFRLSSAAFSRQGIINILKQRIAMAGLPEFNYSGHSFYKKAAQHVADHGMLNEIIQRLGRCMSNAFKLYFTSIPKTLFNLNLSFQKGMLLAVPRTTV